MIERFFEGKTVLRLVSLAVIIYLVMVIVSDFESLVSITVPIAFIFAFLGLALANYFLRAIKWHFYSRELGVVISFKKNLLVFLSGLSMTITPARMGEILKCYLLKKFSVPQGTMEISLLTCYSFLIKRVFNRNFGKIVGFKTVFHCKALTFNNVRQ